MAKKGRRKVSFISLLFSMVLCDFKLTLVLLDFVHHSWVTLSYIGRQQCCIQVNFVYCIQGGFELLKPVCSKQWNICILCLEQFNRETQKR